MYKLDWFYLCTCIKMWQVVFCLVHAINDKGPVLVWVHSCFNVMFVVLVPFCPWEIWKWLDIDAPFIFNCWDFNSQGMVWLGLLVLWLMLNSFCFIPKHTKGNTRTSPVWSRLSTILSQINHWKKIRESGRITTLFNVYDTLWKSWKTLSHPIPNTVPVQSNTPHNLWLLPVLILFRFFSQGVFWSTYTTVKFKILCYLKNHFPNIFQFFLKQINILG